MLIASARYPLNIKIMIAGETGLRPKEVTGETGLKVKDIHRDTKTIVARSLKGCNARPPMLISDELLTIITDYIARKKLKSEDTLFIGKSRNLTRHFIDHKHRLAKRLNDETINQVRLYDIRHYYITKKLRKIGNTEAVRQITGHKNLNTLQKYLHLTTTITGEWITEQTNDRKRADELTKADWIYCYTTPDGYMQFKKQK